MTTPSKSNTLHGSPPATGAPASKVDLPHMPPKPETEPVAETSDKTVSDHTKAEAEAGRKALAAAGDQTKAERELGAKIVGRSATPESTTPENKTPKE